MLKLWGRANSMNVHKPMLMLAELGLAYERIDAGMAYGVVGTPEYRALNPNGVVPTLDHDGFVLWESNTIVRYLAAAFGDATMWPADAKARAHEDQWMDWQQTVLLAPITVCFWGLVRSPGAKTPQEIDAARAQCETAFAALDHWLSTRPFIAGDHFGMADCVLAPAVHRWFNLPLVREEKPHLQAYYERFMPRASVQSVLTLPLT